MEVIMPKITEVFGENMLPPLQQKVLKYLKEHSDEVYSYTDTEELANKIGHLGSKRGLGFSLWALHEKGMIEKESRGRRVYFGSKEAIKEFRRIAKQHSRPQTQTPHIEDIYIPEISPTTSHALRQTLEMMYLVKKHGLPRTKATALVAKRWNIANQTVIDKYCRQLGKTALEIDALLSERDLSNFEILLKSKYPKEEKLISDFIRKIAYNS